MGRRGLNRLLGGTVVQRQNCRRSGSSYSAARFGIRRVGLIQRRFCALLGTNHFGGDLLDAEYAHTETRRSRLQAQHSPIACYQGVSLGVKRQR